MPRKDGTGPRGRGPLSGAGAGDCAVEISETGEIKRGIAGQSGRPVGGQTPAQPGQQDRPGSGRGSGRGRGRGRGQGR